MEETTTIKVGRDTHKDLMLFKIQTNAKNLDSVIKFVIKKLKEELKVDNKKSSSALHSTTIKEV